MKHFRDSIDNGVVDDLFYEGTTSRSGSNLPDESLNGTNASGNIAFTFVLENGDMGIAIWSPDVVDGDFDNDTDVDGADFLTWQRDLAIGDLDDWMANFGSVLNSGPILSGDFDADNDVDGKDLLLWLRDPSIGDLADWEEGFASTPSPQSTVTAVPEPQTVLLALTTWSLAALFSRRFATTAKLKR